MVAGYLQSNWRRGSKERIAGPFNVGANALADGWNQLASHPPMVLCGGKETTAGGVMHMHT
eukprot:2128888-Amphidinium_carterae.1